MAREAGTGRENGRGFGGKYLTFYLGKEEYGLPILVVREIIGMLAITMVPGTESWLRGVINLRGKIIPVCDLRVKFGMSAVETGERSCIVVVQTHDFEMGIVVDQVSEVVDLQEQSVDAAPNLGSQVRTDYLLGIGTTGGKVRLLLDIDKALSTSDVLRARSAGSSGSDDPFFK